MSPDLLIALGTSVCSVALVLFAGGRQVGRVEAAITRLSGIEAKLEKVPIIEAKLGTLEDTYRLLRSDHKELRRQVFGEAVETAEMRGRLESKHDP